MISGFLDVSRPPKPTICIVGATGIPNKYCSWKSQIWETLKCQCGKRWTPTADEDLFKKLLEILEMGGGHFYANAGDGHFYANARDGHFYANTGSGHFYANAGWGWTLARSGGPIARPGGPIARPGGPIARPGGPISRPGDPRAGTILNYSLLIINH